MTGSRTVGLKWLAIVGLALFLLSCGLPPPRNIEQRNIFAYAKEKLKEIEQVSYADQARGKAMGLYKKVPYIIYARQGQSIRFVQQAVEPQPDSLLYSLGNGRYRLTRNLYITMSGKTSYLSLDGQHWFATTAESASSNTGGKSNNLEFRLKFQVVREDSRQLLVNYRAELILAAQLSYTRKSSLNQRSVQSGHRGNFIVLKSHKYMTDQAQAEKLQLETDQMFYDKLMTGIRNSSSEALLLQDNIIFFPKGFEFYYRLLVLGNILQSVTRDEETEAHFLRDVYFYYPHSFFASISFDGESWATNYFQFRLEPFSASVFLSSQSLQYADGFYIYRK